jgi:hypothetical protein
MAEFVRRTPEAPAVPFTAPIWDPISRAPFLASLTGEQIDGFTWDGTAWRRTHPAMFRARLSMPFAVYSPALGDIVIGGFDQAGESWDLCWATRAGGALVRASVPIDSPGRQPSAATDGETTLVHVVGCMQSATVALIPDGVAVLCQLEGAGPWYVAYDELSRRFVGNDSDTTYELKDSAWHEIASSRYGHGFAWDPTTRRLLRSQGEGLASFDGSAWTPVHTSTADVHVGADLVSDPDRRALLFVGGQDFDERGGSPCADTFVSEAGASFRKASCSMPLVVGRYATSGIINGRLAIVNHSSRTLLLRSENLGFERFALRPKSDFDEAFDDRYSNYALYGDSVWALASDGAIYHAKLGDHLARITKPDKKLVRYAHRAVLAWDAPGERLVLYDSEKNRKILVLRRRAKALAELETKTKPPRGGAGIVSTPDGVALITGGELVMKERAWRGGGRLYRLVGDSWKLIAENDAASSRTIMGDPGTGSLFVIGPRGVFGIHGDVLTALAELPADLDFPAHTMNHSDVAAFDPVARSILVASENAVYEMPLGG